MKNSNKNKIIHYVLTRFNLEPGHIINKGLPFHGLDHDWLSHRFDLFYKFCFPSVINQTCLNFKWIILIHESTPDLWINQLKLKIAKTPIPIIIKFGKKNNVDHFKDAISLDIKRESKFYKVLITSRLDNDDCININYVKKVQSFVKGEKKTEYAINFLRGYFHDINNQSLYFLKEYLTNPYLSLVEDPSKGINTVVSFKHRFVETKYETININTKEPMFMTQVHSKNLLNYPLGRPIFSINWRYNFGIEYNEKLSFKNSLFNFLKWVPIRIKQLMNIL